MGYLILFLFGIIIGGALSSLFIIEKLRQNEINDKYSIEPEKIYAPELEPLGEGYEYTGYYVLCNDEWYPVIRKVEDNE